MEELEQALLFLLYIFFSELSFSLHYKVFGRTDRKSWIRIKNYRTDLSLPISVIELLSLQNPHSSCVLHSINNSFDYIWAFSLLWKKELLYSTIRQLLYEGSLEGQETELQVAKTRSICKNDIFLVWLQQILSLLHRCYFLGTSHLKWDPTALQGSVTTNLWSTVNHHQLPKQTTNQNHKLLKLD